MPKRVLSLPAILSSLAAVALACGEAKVSGGDPSPPQTVSVKVEPPEASGTVGGSLSFSAVVTGASNSAVTWSVSPAGGGTVDSNGVYHAPSTPGIFQVIATSVSVPTAIGAAQVNIAGNGSDGSYVFDADRVTTWKPGVTYNGGIPSRTTVCANLNASTFGNGSTDASSAIEAAIQACPAGQVVQLSSGTFRVNNFVLVGKGITLRGAGAGTTVLKKTNGAVPMQATASDDQPLIVVGPSRWPSPDGTTSQNLTGDGAKGSSSVTVANGLGFFAGQIVLLDELSGASWQTDPLGRGLIWASPDWRVVWQLHNPAQGVDDPLLPTIPTSGGAASWFSRQDRPTAEMKEIASVSGNVVTFTTPLHISYRAGTLHRAQLTRYTGASVHVRSAGVENMTLVGGSDGALRFMAAEYSWAKNVEVTMWLGQGVAMCQSFRTELRDSYVHEAAWPSPGGGGYAITLENGTAEALIENNISMLANKVMVARSAGAGSVVGYNYVDDGYIYYSQAWIEVGLNASHMVGPHHVLFEGNYGFNFDSDKTHGNATYHTVFRNWLRCIRRPFVNPSNGASIDDATQTGNAPKRCGGAAAYSYWMTYVGNVLGASGQMNGFTYNGAGPGAMVDPSIWLLGWDDWSPNPYDTKVAATAVRDGNWDWLQAQQTWSNSTPATLPQSLYLTGKPAFFGSNPWPWVDPTTGSVFTLPAKARFDAGTPNVLP